METQASRAFQAVLVSQEVLVNRDNQDLLDLLVLMDPQVVLDLWGPRELVEALVSREWQVFLVMLGQREPQERQDLLVLLDFKAFRDKLDQTGHLEALDLQDKLVREATQGPLVYLDLQEFKDPEGRREVQEGQETPASQELSDQAEELDLMELQEAKATKAHQDLQDLQVRMEQEVFQAV